MADEKKRFPRKSPDERQAEWLALQGSLKKETRPADLALICIFLALILLAGAAVFFLPDREFSEQENRYLQKAPAFTFERLVNGKFTADFADWMSDQFPFRDGLVGLKAACEAALLKQENNGVLLCSGGSLAVRDDYPDIGNLEKNLSAARAFASRVREKGIPVVFAFAGRTQDVAADGVLPFLFDRESNAYLYDALKGAMEGEKYTDLVPVLREHASRGEKVAYSTDHHWTGRGAYLAYAALGEEIGYTPCGENDFEIEVASSSFLGTTWSKAGAKWVSPEQIEYWRFDGDMDMTTGVLRTKRDPERGLFLETAKDFSGFYDRSYLEKKDKYSSFLSGNNPLVEVSSPGEQREKLLLIKDSFSHSLAPFLARHFDLLLVDLRYFNESVDDLIASEGVDKVLILYNTANLCSDASLSTLG